MIIWLVFRRWVFSCSKTHMNAIDLHKISCNFSFNIKQNLTDIFSGILAWESKPIISCLWPPYQRKLTSRKRIGRAAKTLNVNWLSCFIQSNPILAMLCLYKISFPSFSTAPSYNHRKLIYAYTGQGGWVMSPTKVVLANLWMQHKCTLNLMPGVLGNVKA